MSEFRILLRFLAWFSVIAVFGIHVETSWKGWVKFGILLLIGILCVTGAVNWFWFSGLW